MTQRSRASLLMEGRTRPITEPTYLLLQRKSYIVAMKTATFNLIFNIFRKTYSIDLDTHGFLHWSRIIWQRSRARLLMEGRRVLSKRKCLHWQTWFQGNCLGKMRRESKRPFLHWHCMAKRSVTCAETIQQPMLTSVEFVLAPQHETSCDSEIKKEDFDYWRKKLKRAT